MLVVAVSVVVGVTLGDVPVVDVPDPDPVFVGVTVFEGVLDGLAVFDDVRVGVDVLDGVDVLLGACVPEGERDLEAV